MGQANLLETPYMGIEWETNQTTSVGDDNYDVLRKILKLIGTKYVAKADASIGNGFELVSVPMSYEEHLEFMTEYKVKKMFEAGLKKRDIERCGMHIHISRDAFTPEAAARFVAIVTNSKNRKMLEVIGGRQGGSYYSGYADIRYGETLRRQVRTEHESACCIGNKPTYEIRVFKSPTSRKELVGNLQFMQSFWEYCHADAAMTDSMGNYLKWFQKRANCSRYPELYKRLRDGIKKAGHTYDPSKFLYGNYVTVAGICPQAVLSTRKQREVGATYERFIKEKYKARRTMKVEAKQARIQMREAVKLARKARELQTRIATDWKEAVRVGDRDKLNELRSVIKDTPTFEPTWVNGIQVTNEPVWF
jgi:hypothetical protein